MNNYGQANQSIVQQAAAGLNKAAAMRGTLMFEKCARGYIFREGSEYAIPTCYAFNTAHEAAEWLIERYTPADPPACTCGASK